MSVGWGRAGWGIGPWGQPASVSISVNVSGVAGTSALGTISTDAEANVTPTTDSVPRALVAVCPVGVT